MIELEGTSSDGSHLIKAIGKLVAVCPDKVQRAIFNSCKPPIAACTAAFVIA
jgi:hypothetical protein